MSLQVGLHNPVRATSLSYESNGKPCGSVTLESPNGDHIVIYTTPDVAEAIEWIVNNPAEEASAVDVEPAQMSAA